MGRPINKKFIGQGAGKIAVSRYYFTGASEVAYSSTPAWIVSQRSSRKFKVSDGSTTEVLTLVNQSAGDLSEGEFALDATLDDSSVVQVTKLHNRTIAYETFDETTDDSIAANRIKFTVGEQGGNTDGDLTAAVDSQ